LRRFFELQAALVQLNYLFSWINDVSVFVFDWSLDHRALGNHPDDRGARAAQPAAATTTAATTAARPHFAPQIDVGGAFHGPLLDDDEVIGTFGHGVGN